MKLQVPFLQLPLTFDAGALAVEIERIGEAAWRPHPQGFPGNSALPLVAANGDPDDDAVRGVMRPTPHLAQLPYLQQVLESFGAVLGRTRLMRLSGQAEVSAHVDVDYYWREHVRIHVPIVTQPDVLFHCGDRAIHMAAGECWIFDTWRMHRVINSAHQARIHLVADSVGGSGFWKLIAASRVPEMATSGWQPRRVTPTSVPLSPLPFESVNLPTVMSPWEVREHLNFVLDEALPHPQLDAVIQLVSHFCRHWRALWARYGEMRDGWPEYREAAAQFTEELERIGAGIRLPNTVSLSKAMLQLVSGVAVIDESRRDTADERSAPMESSKPSM
ncbi:MAG: aspartyl/asparaginyl beta-hydroxylase domain-containing protein [Tahibacter sp.]